MSRIVAILSSPAGRILRYAASIGLVAALAWSVEWDRWRELPSTLPAGLLVAAIVLAGLAFPLMAWRWWLLTRALGFPAGFTWTHRVTWIGQFYASFLPAGIGGEAARAWFVVRDAPGRRVEGLASIAWDRTLGLFALLALTLMAAAVKLHVIAEQPVLRAAVLLAAAGLMTGVVFIWRVRPTMWPEWLVARIGSDRCRRIEALLAPVRGSGRLVAATILLSIAVWLLDFASIALLARAVGLEIAGVDVAIAGCIAYAAALVPVSIGGHGVREGALVFTFAALGLIAPDGPQRDAVLLLALVWWAVTISWSLAGAVPLLAGRRTSAPPTPSRR